MAENSQDLPKCRRKQAIWGRWLLHGCPALRAAWGQHSRGRAASHHPALHLSSALISQLHVKSSWRTGVSSSVPAWELPPGASVRSAAVCSEVIYLHGPISCKYWQHLGGGLQTLRAATLISAPFHLKASVQQAQKTGAG